MASPTAAAAAAAAALYLEYSGFTKYELIGAAAAGDRGRAAPGGRAERSRQGARLCAAALPRGPLGRLLTPLGPPGYVAAAAARPRVASEARQPRALVYWALMPGFRARRLGLAPSLSRVAGPHPAPTLTALPASLCASRLDRNLIADAPGDLPCCLQFPLRHQAALCAPGQEKKVRPAHGDTLWLRFTNPRSEGKRKKTPSARHLSPRPPPRPPPTALAAAAAGAADSVRPGEAFSHHATARRGSQMGAR